MSEQIVVYAFVDSNGADQDFVTLGRQAAAEYAEMNDFMNTSLPARLTNLISITCWTTGQKSVANINIV